MISVPNNLKVGHLSHCITEDALNTLYLWLYGIRHMVKDQIAREETHCHHMGYSLRLAARFLLYAPSHKLHSVKPVLGEWQSSYRQCRKDEVVLCRARISHTHLTHSYILKKDPPPVCEHCQCNLTVRHILVECNHFAQERKDIFGRRDVVESFRFQPTLIVLFLKQIKFYYTF